MSTKEIKLFLTENLSFKEKKKFLKQLSESDIYSEAIKNVDKKLGKY